MSTPEITPEIQPEASVPPSARHGRLAVLCAMGLLTVGGGYVGYDLNDRSTAHSERTERAQHIRLAREDQNCIAFVQKQAKPGADTAVVRFNTLTSAQRTTCFANWISDMSSDTNTGLATSIVASSLQVQLPSIRSLQADARKEYAKAKDVSGSTANTIAATGLGAELGLFSGLLLEGIRRVRRNKRLRAQQARRRQESAAPPSVDEASA